MMPTRSLANDLSAFGIARSTIQGTPLNNEEARKTHAFWSACNYLALGMIYLQGNPLLREPLKPNQYKKSDAGTLGRQPCLVLYI
jgi:xylulose-5-phosphate/fructose-6-phosphate phosphoketolase